MADGPPQTNPSSGEFAPVVPPRDAPMVYGVTSAPPPAQPAAGPVGGPQAAPAQETVVVPTSTPPPGGAVPTDVIQNPFIPQGVTPNEAQAAPASAGGAVHGSGVRRIIMMLVLLLFVLGIALAGKFALGFLTQQQEVTITYWGLWEDDATVRSVLTAFEGAHPKIKVSYFKQSPKQYRERLADAIARGEGPDVFRFHNTWVPMLRGDLATVPVKIMTAAQFASAFYPVASRDLVAGTNIYGIPLEIDGLGLYYNEDTLAQAGVSVPTTYEELLNVVPKLTVKNGNTIVSSAIALGTTNNVEHFSDIVATMMMQNGAKLDQPTGAEAEQTLIFYRKFADFADPAYTWNETMDNSISAFASGNVAMILAPSWRAFDIKQINPALRFKIAAVPQLPGNTVTWASYWVEGVSSKSKNQNAAWEFVNYLTSREAAIKLYTEESKIRLFGEPYARVELGASIKDDPYAGAFITQASLDARSFPLSSRTFDNGLNDKLIKYLEDAINGMAGGVAPSAVLQTMASGFRQVLGQYGLTSGVAPASR
ncbi:extracellular solute-binding protein [Candidatus Gottesmanbacteria bacterium]|nr:extracellular solute-binding protein [Candidatus Gottesmanbacteria bacterium]